MSSHRDRLPFIRSRQCPSGRPDPPDLRVAVWLSSTPLVIDYQWFWVIRSLVMESIWMSVAPAWMFIQAGSPRIESLFNSAAWLPGTRGWTGLFWRQPAFGSSIRNELFFYVRKRVLYNTLFPKKDRKIVRMDQKWTKRQNERSPASRKMDLVPFNIQATIYTLMTSSLGLWDHLGLRSPKNPRVIPCIAYTAMTRYLGLDPENDHGRKNVKIKTFVWSISGQNEYAYRVLCFQRFFIHSRK